mmetsp:Transcript_12542/g.32091  ORF Transcript_12542/g.32091 Transcript_12542/m.32091 type:complete len:227 (+) Transcript_12542:1457-2137(+)
MHAIVETAAIVGHKILVSEACPALLVADLLGSLHVLRSKLVAMGQKFPNARKTTASSRSIPTPDVTGFAGCASATASKCGIRDDVGLPGVVPLKPGAIHPSERCRRVARRARDLQRRTCPATHKNAMEPALAQDGGRQPQIVSLKTHDLGRAAPVRNADPPPEEYLCLQNSSEGRILAPAFRGERGAACGSRRVLPTGVIMQRVVCVRVPELAANVDHPRTGPPEA